MAAFDVTRELNYTVTDLPSAVEALRDHTRFARDGSLTPVERAQYEGDWAEAFVARVAALAVDAAASADGGER